MRAAAAGRFRQPVAAGRLGQHLRAARRFALVRPRPNHQFFPRSRCCRWRYQRQLFRRCQEWVYLPAGLSHLRLTEFRHDPPRQVSRAHLLRCCQQLLWSGFPVHPARRPKPVPFLRQRLRLRPCFEPPSTWFSPLAFGLGLRGSTRLSFFAPKSYPHSPCCDAADSSLDLSAALSEAQALAATQELRQASPLHLSAQQS